MDGNNGGLSETTTVILFVCVVGIIWGIFYFFEPVIHYIWMLSRLVVITSLVLLPDIYQVNAVYPADQFMVLLRDVHPSQISSEFIANLDSELFMYVSWVIVAFLYFLTRKVEYDSEITASYSMEALLKKKAETFPFLRPYINFNPAKMKDLDFDRDDSVKNQYLPALKPYEWALLSPPMGLEDKAKTIPGYRVPVWDGEDYLDTDLAQKAFDAQLKTPFVDLRTSLNEVQKDAFRRIYENVSVNKELSIKFIAEFFDEKINEQGLLVKDKLSHMVYGKSLEVALFKLFKEKVAELSSSEGDSLDGVVAAKKYFSSPNNRMKIVHLDEFESLLGKFHAESIMYNHGFVETGLFSLIEAARGSGVLGAVEFIDIKGKDRALWYIIQSVGRKTPFVEAAGVYAHWLLERMVGMPVPQPETTSAVEALEINLYVDKKSLMKKKEREEREKL